MDGQEPNQNQTPAGQAPVEQNVQDGSSGGAGTQQSEPQTFDAAYVKKLRDEAARYRTEKSELETWKKEREQADMTELERVKAEKETTYQQLQKIRSDYEKAQRDMAITQAAAKAGFPVDAALKLAEVEVADDGSVTGVEAAIAKLVADYPGMMPQAASTSNGSSMNGSRDKKQTELTIEEIEKKSPEWINANWELVEAAHNKIGK